VGQEGGVPETCNRTDPEAGFLEARAIGRKGVFCMSVVDIKTKQQQGKLHQLFEKVDAKVMVYSDSFTLCASIKSFICEIEDGTYETCALLEMLPDFAESIEGMYLELREIRKSLADLLANPPTPAT
jgi:hypothetical protein